MLTALKGSVLFLFAITAAVVVPYVGPKVSSNIIHSADYACYVFRFSLRSARVFGEIKIHYRFRFIHLPIILDLVSTIPLKVAKLQCFSLAHRISH